MPGAHCISATPLVLVALPCLLQLRPGWWYFLDPFVAILDHKNLDGKCPNKTFGSPTGWNYPQCPFNWQQRYGDVHCVCLFHQHLDLGQHLLNILENRFSPPKHSVHSTLIDGTLETSIELPRKLRTVLWLSSLLLQHKHMSHLMVEKFQFVVTLTVETICGFGKWHHLGRENWSLYRSAPPLLHVLWPLPNCLLAAPFAFLRRLLTDGLIEIDKLDLSKRLCVFCSGFLVLEATHFSGGLLRCFKGVSFGRDENYANCTSRMGMLL